MGSRRPWQALFRPDRTTRIRSRSFQDADTALSWAQAYVREVGDDALVHVGFKEAADGSSPSASEMPSHIVTSAAGEIFLRSWPALTEEQATQQVRDALAGQPSPHGPTVSLARHRPFTVLPGGRSESRSTSP